MAEHAGPPDALMRQPIDTSAELTTALAGRRISAICLGPGCGVDRAGALLPQALASGLPCLLDADALTALAQAPQPLRDNVALTPHMGEFARLFPDIAAGLGDDPQARLGAAKQAARRSGAVVLLKGPDTAIAAPDGRALLHSAPDVPWLATAGSGDVLAGLMTGLLARGFAALDGAWAAAHIHAAAARRFGPGLIADDLVEQIPAILHEIA